MEVRLGKLWVGWAMGRLSKWLVGWAVGMMVGRLGRWGQTRQEKRRWCNLGHLMSRYFHPAGPLGPSQYSHSSVFMSR